MDIGETKRITERPAKPVEAPTFAPPASVPEWLDPNKITTKEKEKVPATVGS